MLPPVTAEWVEDGSAVGEIADTALRFRRRCRADPIEASVDEVP